MNWHNNRPRWRFSYWGGTSRDQSQVANTKFSYPLTQGKIGTRVWVVKSQEEMGIKRGEIVEIINIQLTGSVLLKIGDKTLGLGPRIAREILVSDYPLNQSKEIEMITDIRTYIREMDPGTLVQIVGYDRILQGYKGKLLAMGLTPGTKFMVLSVPPAGDPVKIRLGELIITLPKQEADALVVEVVDN